MKPNIIFTLLLFGLTLVSCGQSSNQKHVLSETYLEEMIQLAIDLPQLQPYYHVDEDTSRRQIVFQHFGGFDYKRLGTVNKFGRPIIVMTESEIKTNRIESYFVVDNFVSTTDFIQLQLKYPIEGLLVYYKYKRVGNKLTITNFNLTEI